MGTILRDVSIAWMLIHCIVMFMFLFESRYPKNKTIKLTCLTIIPLMILTMICVILLGADKAGQLMIFICVIPSLIFFLFMAKQRNARFLFTFCLVDTTILWIMYVTNLIDSMLGVGNYIVMFVLRLIIPLALEFLILRYFRKSYRLFQQKIKKGWGVFSIMSVIFYIMMLLIANISVPILNNNQISGLVMMLILMPVVYTTIFYVLNSQLKLSQAREETHSLSMQIKITRDRLDSSYETQNNLRILRHDMKHHMMLLGTYIENNELDRAKEYIGDISKKIAESTLHNYCKNNAVNAVMSYFCKIADTHGIEIETKLNLPETLRINETDFAVVLSNGIENAINAVKDSENKKISVKAFIEDEKIYLEIKNPFDGNVDFENGIPVSTEENHGYGTKSMATLIQKNDGIYSFVLEDGYFVFRCAV